MSKHKNWKINKSKTTEPAPGSIEGLKKTYGNFFVPQGPWEKITQEIDARLETITPRNKVR
jgi:hypothetical protein